MLLDFQVENFRSYHSPKLFSLVASRQEDLPENLMDAKDFGLRVLRSAAIYGANASGKTNLFHAIWALGSMIRMAPDVFRSQTDIWPPVFALTDSAINKPTRFEINFLAHAGDDGAWTRYEYHIGVLGGRVVEEWLNAYPAGGKRQRWFVREPADSVPANIKFSKYVKGAHEKLKDVTPPEMPFLFAAQRFGNPQLSIPAKWIQRNCDNQFELVRRSTTAQLDGDPSFNAWVSEFMRHADLGIQEARVELHEMSPEEIAATYPPRHLPSFQPIYQERVSFLHKREGGAPIRLEWSAESEGTHRLFGLLGPLRIALRDGLLLLVDEMIASMHPLLTSRFIEAFHDPKVNTKGAQLVLTTHDVSLLRGDLFRRDQVWFTEKSPAGETDLYSLHKFQPRPDASLEKNYLAGRYGGIPFLGTLNFGSADGEKEGQEGRKAKARPRLRKTNTGSAETGA